MVDFPINSMLDLSSWLCKHLPDGIYVYTVYIYNNTFTIPNYRLYLLTIDLNWFHISQQKTTGDLSVIAHQLWLLSRCSSCWASALHLLLFCGVAQNVHRLSWAQWESRPSDGSGEHQPHGEHLWRSVNLRKLRELIDGTSKWSISCRCVYTHPQIVAVCCRFVYSSSSKVGEMESRSLLQNVFPCLNGTHWVLITHALR